MAGDMATEMKSDAPPSKNKKRDVKDAKGGKFAAAFAKRFGKK